MVQTAQALEQDIQDQARTIEALEAENARLGRLVSSWQTDRVCLEEKVADLTCKNKELEDDLRASRQSSMFKSARIYMLRKQIREMKESLANGMEAIKHAIGLKEF
jgi:predicted RNase H-like nuclease (RuvC/YqgF family)